MKGTYWVQGYNRPTGCSVEKAPHATFTLGPTQSDLPWGQLSQTFPGANSVRLTLGQLIQTYLGANSVRLTLGPIQSDLPWGQLSQTYPGANSVKLTLGPT